MNKIILTTLVITFSSIAFGEMSHQDYCSEFERQNGCSEYLPGSNSGWEICSCAGNILPQTLPSTRVRCDLPNHMTGMRQCCQYVNNVQQDCWTN